MEAFVCLLLAPTIAAQTITLSGNGTPYFAVNPADHFLYSAESTNANPKHFDVISTLTNTVVGTYSYTGGGYSSQLAASGTSVFWADQGGSAVKVFSVNPANGTPTLTRTDSLTLATGVAALATNYAANLQGTGDVMKIVQTSNGTVQVTTNLGGVAGVIFSDPTSNYYYANSSANYQVIDGATGNIVRTLSGGFVTAIDPSPGHHFVYFVNGSNTRVLQQLNGVSNAATGKSYDFGSGATINNATVDVSTGNIWVSLTGQNKVAALDANLNLLQQFNLAGPDAIAFQDGNAYVHLAGTNTIAIIAVPETGTWGLLAGGAALVAIAFRRRRQR